MWVQCVLSRNTSLVFCLFSIVTAFGWHRNLVKCLGFANSLYQLGNLKMSINPTNDIRRYKTCLNFWLRKKKKLQEWAYWWVSFKPTVAELLSEWEPHKGAQFPVELTWGRSRGGIRALEKLNKGLSPEHDMTGHDDGRSQQGLPQSG